MMRVRRSTALAAGLSVAGAKPLILIQNTGMMESGDSIRGWLMGLQVPVVLMVGYRGYTRHGVNTDTAAIPQIPTITNFFNIARTSR